MIYGWLRSFALDMPIGVRAVYFINLASAKAFDPVFGRGHRHHVSTLCILVIERCTNNFWTAYLHTEFRNVR